MKKILFFASALAGLFFAASCQQENLEPVQQGNTVTYTVQLPDAIGTKAIGTNVSTVTELIYEVYRIHENGDETRLYQMKKEMTGGSAIVELELVNNQDFRVLFWAQVPGNGVYTTTSLKSVTLNQNLSANAENYAAFAGQDEITDGENLVGRTITLFRPVAQLNIATSAESLKLGEGGNVNTTVSFATTGVVVKGLSTVYNVAEGAGVAANDGATFTYEAKPVALSENTIKVNNVDYTYVSMNYVGFASKTGDNVKVSYTINTTNVGTITNTVENVPVKANYRTNIIGNLITSTSDYTVTLDDTWPEEETNVEVVSVSTAADLQEAIDDIPAGTEGNIKLEGDINLNDLFAELTTKSASADPQSITIPVGDFTLDLNGYSITGVDEATGSFGLINNKGNLTITNSSSNSSRIALVATNEREWNAYSSVISNNPGGNLLVKGNVVIEHLGGTAMAYGIDNLTNGKGTSAIATVEGATVKSTYRAIRQFLNGIEATNELYVKAGSKIYGTANKSIWMQDPSKNANTGKLVVEAGAELYGDVYLTVTAGSTEWPVQVSIADAALQEGYTVLTNNTLDKYELVNSNGVWTVETSLIEESDVVTVYSAGALKKIADKVNAGEDYFAGKTIKLGADIDLNNQEWIPIGSAVKDHGFMGNFDGNGYAIKNLKMTELALDADNYVYAGLFGVTEGTSATQQNYIKNLVIENVTIETTGHIAAAAIAYPYYTVVENVTVKGNINIKGGDYTSGALAYTRRCVNAKGITVTGNEGSVIEGNSTVGGVISDIQMNGGLTADYSNFKATGLTIKANKCVGGISGIISNQTLNGATVENVTLVCNDNRTGIVAGADGGKSTLTNVSYENVTGATRVIGATYDKGYYVGQILEVAGVKAVIYSIEDGVKVVSVDELNLNGKYWQDAMDWAAGLGEGWALASMEELNAIYDARFELNDALETNNKDNSLFWEGDELYIKNGSVYYALYISSTEVPVGEKDANGNDYWENRVFFKKFNKLGYSDVLYSAFDCINKYAPLRDNYFARATYTL